MQIGHSCRVAALGLLCAAIGLSGCGGSSKAAHPVTPTSTFSDPRGTGSPASSRPAVATTGPNLRPGEKPPVLSPVGKTNSPLGADVFARYWFMALDWGYATTDSTLARSLYSRACTDCARFMQNFDGPRAMGEHFSGGRVVTLATSLVDGRGHNGATRADDVTINVGALKTIDGSGKVVSSGAAIPKITYRLWIKWTGEVWTVVDSKHVVYK